MYVDCGYANNNNNKAKMAIALYLTTTIPLIVGSLLLISGRSQINMNRWTIRGVPVPIILEFLKDETARKAYFQGNKNLLHDRLDEMGIEEKVKDFYREQIPNEYALDRHIHQIFYNNTGYVGKAYKVNSQGNLVNKN
ncbi:hypothetical protein NIES593_09825 [Hydrococcus rivularis NIES-593]|uniref:Uncharacterized protein n=1 Tax=Hydrococcus rivularis NIES-593 TaxID=1921803 RepID=A0A1U7HIU8_9CYAN|nr:hypothetical protein [Hydrococcus rivularis]OKH23516.1 hypothetical protein NIES593_09825 [Hydrococcus rivularis NIES-593]